MNKKTLIIILLVLGILVLGSCVCCTGIGMLGTQEEESVSEQEDTEDITTEEAQVEDESQSEVTTEENSEDQEDVIEALLDADDFNKTTVESLRQKYGTPILDDQNTLPSFSYIGFETDNYYTQSSYPSDDKRVFGVEIWLKNESCDPDKKGINQIEFERLFKLVGVEYNPDANWEYTSIVYDLQNQKQTNGYEDWEVIYISCDEGGTVISFHSHGWMDR